MALAASSSSGSAATSPGALVRDPARYVAAPPFPDDEACLTFLWCQRYAADGEHAYCPRCRHIRVFRRYQTAESRKSWTCSRCGLHLHPTAGTIFEKSSTGLRTWFSAIALMAGSCGGITARELQRQLGIGYRAARRIKAQLAEAVDFNTPAFADLSAEGSLILSLQLCAPPARPPLSPLPADRAGPCATGSRQVHPAPRHRLPESRHRRDHRRLPRARPPCRTPLRHAPWTGERCKPRPSAAGRVLKARPRAAPEAHPPATRKSYVARRDPRRPGPRPDRQYPYRTQPAAPRRRQAHRPRARHPRPPGRRLPPRDHPARFMMCSAHRTCGSASLAC